MHKELPGMPRIKVPIADVRDVTIAHLQGLKVHEARNKRFMICAKTMWLREIGEILNKHYNNAYRVNAHEMSYCVVKTVSLCNKDIRPMLPIWGVPLELDTS